MIVAPVGQYHWTGIQAGLRYPDKILTANGKQIEGLGDLNRIIVKINTGTPIEYEVSREGKILISIT